MRNLLFALSTLLLFSGCAKPTTPTTKAVTYSITDAEPNSIKGYYKNEKGERVNVSSTSFTDLHNWSTVVNIEVGKDAEIEIFGTGYDYYEGMSHIQKRFKVAISEGGTIKQEAQQVGPAAETIGVSYTVK